MFPRRPSSVSAACTWTWPSRATSVTSRTVFVVQGARWGQERVHRQRLLQDVAREAEVPDGHRVDLGDGLLQRDLRARAHPRPSRVVVDLVEDHQALALRPAVGLEDQPAGTAPAHLVEDLLCRLEGADRPSSRR
jgi:hypothetical protein